MLALTDLATTDVQTKMALCMGATCIAQADTCTCTDVWSRKIMASPNWLAYKVTSLPAVRAARIARRCLSRSSGSATAARSTGCALAVSSTREPTQTSASRCRRPTRLKAAARPPSRPQARMRRPHAAARRLPSHRWSSPLLISQAAHASIRVSSSSISIREQEQYFGRGPMVITPNSASQRFLSVPSRSSTK